MVRLRQFFGSLRFRLLVLVVLVCSPLVVLTLHTAGDERRKAVGLWQDRAEKLADFFNRQEAELAATTRGFLFALAESGAVRSGNPRESKQLFEDMFGSHSRYANIGIIRHDGHVLASSYTVPAELLREENQFFRRALSRRAFSIGRYQASPGDPTVVYFGQPVYNDEREVQSVVFATVNLEDFERSLSNLPENLPEGAWLTKVDTTGLVLARIPNPDGHMGQTYGDTNLLAAATEHKVGVMWGGGWSEGDVHAYASFPSALAGRQVVAILSVPSEVLFRSTDDVMLRNLTWLGAAALVALVLGFTGSMLLVVRPFHALLRYTTLLVSGQRREPVEAPKARHELGMLATQFNHMAQALEQSELERRDASQKVQTLSQRLVEVQENERRQIARELHDEVGQSLTAAEIHLQAALKAIPDSRTAVKVQASLQAVEHVLQQVHDLCLDLRPSMLDDLGLEPALRWYASRQAEAAGLKLDFRSEGLEHRLAPIIETECFRIGQEAITNVVRHAKAQTLAIELEPRDGELHLHVRDDGIGFDPVAARSRAVQGLSLGVLSMEERAGLGGGTLEFESAPGTGTRVHASFPLLYHGHESSLNA